MNSSPVQQNSDTNNAGRDMSPAAQRRPRYWLYLLSAAFVVILLVYLLGWLPREKRDQQVKARATQQKNSLPVVQVVTVQQTPRTEELTLPGTVVPVSTAHIYSRAAGYLKVLKVDVGDYVRQGQILATIDSPEIDTTVQQQHSLLEASKNALQTARSQLALQQATYDRVHVLFQHGILSQQDDDVASATLKAAADSVHAAENNVNAAQSALAHWTTLASYEQVRSPINGTVTARNVEVGSLVAGSGGGQGLTPAPSSSQSGGPETGGSQGGELFQITNVHNLRTFINVPEENALDLKTGQPATLTFSELPGHSFQGKVIRSSDSLNQQTRTLLLEIQIVDPQNRLRPGMFASVQLHFPAPNPGILVPGDSLIPRAQGQFVAIVNSNVIHLQEVRAGRDLGTQVYITTGLKDGDQVVVNPTDVVQEGVHVEAKDAPKGQEK